MGLLRLGCCSSGLDQPNNASENIANATNQKVRMVKRKAEYIEGPKARENFERFTSAILQLPKAGTKRTAKAKKKATARKTSGKKRG